MAASPFSLDGRIAVVTGGGLGIGRSISLEFARAGADVVVASRKLEHLEAVVAEIKALGRRSFAMAVDVRQEEGGKELGERAVRDLGRLDVMVNNAGASFRAKPEDISPNGWNAVIGINLNGVFFGCKWAGRQMLGQGRGVIINISSIAGVYGSTMMPHYGAAKAAVINFTRTLGMASGRLDVLHKTNPDAKKTYDAVANRVGMGRWGRVEEIAYPCVFLASDASSFMTGETIIVDGGAAPHLGEG